MKQYLALFYGELEGYNEVHEHVIIHTEEFEARNIIEAKDIIMEYLDKEYDITFDSGKFGEYAHMDVEVEKVFLVEINRSVGIEVREPLQRAFKKFGEEREKKRKEKEERELYKKLKKKYEGGAKNE